MAKLVATLILISTVLCSLSGCLITGEFVAAHLESYGVPDFKHSKLKSVEVLYRDYYVKDVPPAEKPWAVLQPVLLPSNF